MPYLHKHLHHKRLYTGSDKRSQITPFIIIGLLVLVAAVIFSYVVITKQRERAGQEAEEMIEAGVLPPLGIYVQRCIDKESTPLILQLAENGGVLNPKEGSFLWYNKTKLSYLCVVEGPGIEFACTNTFLTRQEMQRILAKEIANNLKRCVNMKPFEAQGYKVDEGILAVRASITKKSVIVEADYPINITKEDETIEVSKFSSEMNIPLGELYELATDITNREISDGYFDIDGWMKDNGARIIIEKHRPYPDIVYILSEKLSQSFKQDAVRFRFAVQQNPSIAQRRPEQEQLYGICANPYDDMCFQNVPDAYCRSVDGVYSQSVQGQPMSCSDNFRQQNKGALCDGGACKDCENDIWGRKFDVPKKNGESWCVYDGITGKGYDYVGSRHYKHSCVNGKAYAEECRDYREELCTEQDSADSAGMSKAVCRVNRWNDCAYCTSEECCKDTRYRDCYWDEGMTTSRKCVPEVPPGIRFWENEGMDICLRGNDNRECRGISCPNVWIDDTARFCYRQSDCGNYRNIADQITYQGFFQSDPADMVRENVYLQDGWNVNPLPDGRSWGINLPIESREQADMVNEGQEYSPLGNIPLMISAGLGFIDEILSIDISDFLKPWKTPEIKIIDFALCSVWTAPTSKNYCVLCGVDPAKPCSEYRCKSLGQRCQFSMDEGVPRCELPSLVDKKPPVIRLNKEALSRGYGAEEAELAGNGGFHITPAIKPHRPFTFGINTSEPTRCRLKLSPRFDYFTLPSFWFNDPGFKEEHNLTIRMPPRLSVPKKLLDMLNITSTGEVIPFLENLEPLYEQYSDRIREKLSLYSAITGKDVMEDVDREVKRAISFINGMTPYIKNIVTAMIDQFDRGGYYIFVECSDMAGNVNKDEFFVKFEVDSDYEDNEAPVIVHTTPQNNSKLSSSERMAELSIYVDEPAECRYAAEDMEFSSMEKSFACSTGYHISPVAGGTYECNAVIDRNIYNMTFIRCKDRPSLTEQHTLSMIKSLQTGIAGIEKYNTTNISPYVYANVSGSKIEVPSDMINDLTFRINSFPADLRLYLPQDMECRHSNTTSVFDEMDGKFGKCITTDRIERGIYECKAEIEEPSPKRVMIGNYTLKIEKTDEYGIVSGYMSDEMDMEVRGSLVQITSEGRLIGESNIKVNDENTAVELKLKGMAECNATIENRTSAMICSQDDDPDGSGTSCVYTTTISERADLRIQCLNTTASDEKHYEVNIACAEPNATMGNVNDKSYEFVIGSAEPLNMSIKPDRVVTEDEADLTVKVSSPISKSGIVCGYNDNPFYGMISMDKIAADRFGVHLTGLEDGKKYRYYVQCRDDYGNEAEGYTEFEVDI